MKENELIIQIIIVADFTGLCLVTGPINFMLLSMACKYTLLGRYKDQYKII